MSDKDKWISALQRKKDLNRKSKKSALLPGWNLALWAAVAVFALGLFFGIESSPWLASREGSFDSAPSVSVPGSSLLGWTSRTSASGSTATRGSKQNSGLYGAQGRRPGGDYQDFQEEEGDEEFSEAGKKGTKNDGEDGSDGGMNAQGTGDIDDGEGEDGREDGGAGGFGSRGGGPGEGPGEGPGGGNPSAGRLDGSISGLGENASFVPGSPFSGKSARYKSGSDLSARKLAVSGGRAGGKAQKGQAFGLGAAQGDKTAPDAIVPPGSKGAQGFKGRTAKKPDPEEEDPDDNDNVGGIGGDVTPPPVGEGTPITGGGGGTGGDKFGRGAFGGPAGGPGAAPGGGTEGVSDTGTCAVQFAECSAISADYDGRIATETAKLDTCKSMQPIGKKGAMVEVIDQACVNAIMAKVNNLNSQRATASAECSSAASFCQ